MLTTDLMNKIRHIEIKTRRLVNDSFAGEYHSVFKGRGMEFDEVRPYSPGDEIRTIDWNVTARTGHPYVKRYVEERELTVMLMVDASGSGDFGTVGKFRRELAAELAAVLSFAATTNKDRVGLVIFTDRIELFIPPRKGRKHVLRLIHELLTFEPEGQRTNIRLALDHINQILKRRSIIFLISDFLANPSHYSQQLYITNRKHDVIAVDLSDPLEHTIANVGLLAMQDAETEEVVWVDTSSPIWQHEFAAHTTQFQHNKHQVVAGAGVDQIMIQTDQDYVKALTQFFERRVKKLRH
jgi:uncharacterized protein (DUF58 family)